MYRLLDFDGKTEKTPLYTKILAALLRATRRSWELQHDLHTALQQHVLSPTITWKGNVHHVTVLQTD